MSTTSFRRVVTVAALALGAALAAACGPDQTAGADPPVTDGVEGVGAIGSGGPTTIVDPPVAPTDISPTYPDTAEGYAQEVIEAWAGDQPSWLEALTNESVYDGIVDLNASPYDEWTLLRCDGTAGSSYCSFTNPAADVLTLRISHQLLGQAHAATEVSLDKTAYSNDAVLYVKEFVEAWQFGNTARMLLLSSPAVVNKVPDTAPTSVTYLPLDCCGGGLAQVKVKIGNPTARFDVGTTKLGGPNAILDYAVEFGLTN
jgi:hypothetical protein